LIKNKNCLIKINYIQKKKTLRDEHPNRFLRGEMGKLEGHSINKDRLLHVEILKLSFSFQPDKYFFIVKY
jgi:hypothetical protein